MKRRNILHTGMAAMLLLSVSACEDFKFGNDFLDDTEVEQTLGVEFQMLGGIGRTGRILVEDTGARLRGDDREIGVFEHPDLVRDRERERAAARPLADHDGDDRYFQGHHFIEIFGDGFSLAAFFRPLAAGGALRVHKADDGAAELFRLVHEAERLTVPLRRDTAEVARDALGQAMPLFDADDGDGDPGEESDPADQRRVVAVASVAVELGEVADDRVDIVEGGGSARFSRTFDLIVGLHDTPSLLSRMDLEQIREVFFVFFARDDIVEETVRELELRTLEVFGQFLPRHLFDQTAQQPKGEIEQRQRHAL